MTDEDMALLERSITFNSLSRDHSKEEIARSLGLSVEAFNSLSRDHLKAKE